MDKTGRVNSQELDIFLKYKYNLIYVSSASDGQNLQIIINSKWILPNYSQNKKQPRCQCHYLLIVVTDVTVPRPPPLPRPRWSPCPPPSSSRGSMPGSRGPPRARQTWFLASRSATATQTQPALHSSCPEFRHWLHQPVSKVWQCYWKPCKPCKGTSFSKDH